MIVDNLADTLLYLEKKSYLKILVNNNINSKGMLETDNNSNSLISIVDSGDTCLYRISKYTGNGSVMLYNPTTKALQLARQGDLLSVSLDFEKGTKYYINSELIIASNPNLREGYFMCSLNSKNILKLFLNGVELKNYRVDKDKIYILGQDRDSIDSFSDLVIYAYETSIIGSNSNVEIEIEYYQYEKVFDYSTFINGEYFETFRGENFDCFEELSLTSNVVKTDYKQDFQYSKTYLVNSIENSLDFSVFSLDDKLGLLEYVGNDEFRIILVNPIFGRIVLINNCRVVDGVSISYDKSKNTKRFIVNCGNYLDIVNTPPSIYGKGRYGKYIYGGGEVYVINSHRNNS